MSRPARFPLHIARACIAACTWTLLAVPARAEPVGRIHELAQQEKAPLLDTLRDLVNIESGSKDAEGLARLAALIGERLTKLGGKVEIIEPADIYRMEDTPEKPGAMVHAEFKGTGSKKIMLIAHMDTVYLRGMLKDQPFRIDGERAYGLGIADDKQGVALILHTVAMLQTLKFRDYGTLTVLINGDEEISSPGSRSTITRMAGEQDAVFSYEGGGEDGRLRLATSGIGAAYLTVDGKASHAGSAPDRGVNALVELSHQVLQLSDLSRRDQGLTLNWTVSQAGTNRNVIPAQATAQGDARALKVSDFTELEATLRQRVQSKQIPDAKVQLRFEMRRPPLEATPGSRRLAAHGTAIYEELGLPLKVFDVASGGGTDAAFAALKTTAPVIEGFGLSGYGAHSNDAEYVKLETIVPRLYLSARMIMDVSQDKVK
jgi:glutamate carboxypeptidase